MTNSNAPPALKPAEQNPWYLLATLYGEPEWHDEELQAKNRVAWNRYYASIWTDKRREALKGRVDAAELVPFSDAELTDIRQRFRTRAGTDLIEMPDANREIDFNECQFDQSVFFNGYVFGYADFSSATFSGEAYFRSATFSGGAYFSSATFSGSAYFRSATFSLGADFSSATFSGGADFSSATFSWTAYFSSATFSWTAYFSSATFSRYADFSSATFSGDAYFSSATFSGNAYFSSATFSEDAYFRSATFSGDAYFRSATFSGYADFSSATFSGTAYFSSATFHRAANFSSATFHRAARFTNSELKAPTNFENSRFLGEPPRFHGGKLHEDTVWRGVGWPPAPANPSEAGRFTDAYERLKQEMDRLKKHEDELMFFAKELACRRVARGQIRGWPIGAYGVLCHYGQSYMLPLGWLVALILVGAVQFWPVLGWDFLLALGVSTANTLGPLGLRKELMDAGTLPPDLSRWLRFLSGAQMVIGLILLFLIGLGLRNRFRMK